ncbi:hypothetical protein NL393_35395, partial [Klebsiella pneumoniae]|nr:hypothetical protein [Klebsiella pneumoniae]
YDGDYEGDFAFAQENGENTFTAIWSAISSNVSWGAVVIAFVSLAFLFWWDAKKPSEGALKFLPGPLVVVLFGIGANALFSASLPHL